MMDFTKMIHRAGLLLLAVVAMLVPSLPAAAVDIEKVVSKGEIEAWLVRDTKNPIIAMQFAFEGGTERDPADKLGLAIMVASTMDEGAGNLDSQAFQGKLDENSITLSFNAGRDAFVGQLVTLRETKDTAFDLMRLALTQPRFDMEAVERIRGQLQTSLRRSQADPSYWAQLAFGYALFPNHPYGLPQRGFTETLAAITRDDLVQFARTRLSRQGLKVAVSGDITAKELAPLLDKLFGALPVKATLAPVADVTPAAQGKTILVPRPIPQTVMVLAHSGLDRSDPDWYAATIVNYVLGGGGFSSRLMDEVREKRGLTYGIGSSLQSFDHANLITVSGSTVNEKAAEAISVTKQIWGEVAKNGITEAELRDAQTYLTGSFPLQFTNNGAIAGLLLQVQRDDLGIDFLNKRNDLLNAVTISDVKRVADRLLDPEKLTTVLVGQPVGIEPTGTFVMQGQKIGIVGPEALLDQPK
ncbi:peptidase M16 [Niveispirillum lacus]|uniref:Peptidase M16 n=1 Tax=Niveispirillum lacus TaxID=1981099 RepID=A0A255YTB8_9PROT|nr:pitrilysin family protein [Niveispirillum lacus]OYQ32486.1 peptidase M16 [Niveispirillum lacus]